MSKGKTPSTKGKISFTRYFQKFNAGDYVAVVVEPSVIFGYTGRVKGKTGKVISKRGSAYCVEINDLNKAKRYVIKPVHLKKIKIN